MLCFDTIKDLCVCVCVYVHPLCSTEFFCFFVSISIHHNPMNSKMSTNLFTYIYVCIYIYSYMFYFVL